MLWGVACATASDCWAVGGKQLGTDPGPVALAEHWDGASWSVTTLPATHGFLFSVTCTSPAGCWAVGTTTTDNDQTDPLNGFIDHWDGTSWSQAPTQPSGQAFDGFNSVTCGSASDCWAVGFAGPNPVANGFLPDVAPRVAGDDAFIEHWDGTGWTVADTPGANGPNGAYLSGVTCSGSSQCWAVGATMDANGNPSTTLVDHWDGTGWSTYPSPAPPAGADLLTAVTCTGPNACWAVGASDVVSGQNSNSQPSPFVESWSGSAWSIDPSPTVTALAYLDSVACVRANGCMASGFAATDAGSNFTLRTLVEQMVLPPGGNQGLWMSGSDGGVFSFGDAGFHGSMGGARLNAPIVGMASTPDGGGYWEVAADGGVFSFGDADFHGSVPGQGIVPGAPVSGMVASPSGRGYWLVGTDGALFAYGDASFLGSLVGTELDAPVTGVASS
jgi:hypothetical protein